MTAPQTRRRRRRAPRPPAHDEAFGQVVIGPREIYNLLVDVKAGVADLAKDRDALKLVIAKHEDRLSALEKWRWLATGAAAVGGGILTKALEALTK